MSEKILRKKRNRTTAGYVKLCVAHTLSGKTEGAVTLMPDIWNFTEVEWGLCEYLLDLQDEQNIVSNDSDPLPLSYSGDRSESAIAAKRPFLTLISLSGVRKGM